ncbi:hypothetical protein FQA39_LY01524 [Lamprigera yunnana]|nr:hypothetical protein FQA39_LY01524 [Lamprigera yunnana]
MRTRLDFVVLEADCKMRIHFCVVLLVKFDKKAGSRVVAEGSGGPGFSLSDALDIIFANDDIANQVDEVFIEPPEATVDTDEDSAEADQGGMLHNLTGRQLRAPVEIRLIDNTRINTNKHASVSSSESPPSESAPSRDHVCQGLTKFQSNLYVTQTNKTLILKESELLALTGINFLWSITAYQNVTDEIIRIVV